MVDEDAADALSWSLGQGHVRPERFTCWLDELQELTGRLGYAATPRLLRALGRHELDDILRAFLKEDR
jgi:hypothetical protein